MKGILVVDDATREMFARDHHRPTYHFLPPMNWMNDPNGLVQWKGVYHLFYQHNPIEAKWGPMHWGHATSTDLLHWKHQPIALEPEAQSPDADGCWSGVTVVHEGLPVVVYSGNSRDSQRCCLATSQDDLETLQKDPRNPVIPDLPKGFDIDQYRDHCLWQEGGVWQQLVGARVRDEGGCVLLYRSQDLVDWQFIGPILRSGASAVDPLPKNAMWECPDLFPVGDRHMLVISILTDRPQHTGYFLGRYADGIFHPDEYHRLDYGDWEYYAPQSFINQAGERIHFGWIQEARSIDWQLQAGWSGVLSLPRRMFLHPDGQVGIEPHPQVNLLRGPYSELSSVVVQEDNVLDTGLRGNAFELRAAFGMETGTGEVGLNILCAPDGSEFTQIVYNRQTSKLSLIRTHSSLDERAYSDGREGDLVLGHGEDLELHIFIDHSVIEIFANQRVSLTARAYPTQPDSTGVQVLARGGRALLKKLETWQIKTIW